MMMSFVYQMIYPGVLISRGLVGARQYAGHDVRIHGYHPGNREPAGQAAAFGEGRASSGLLIADG